MEGEPEPESAVRYLSTRTPESHRTVLPFFSEPALMMPAIVGELHAVEFEARNAAI
jgi:hypothetical protein